jgi:DNA helicase-2/ATP-dependent DNA helicase PcrA
MADLLAALNPVQQQAVLHGEGPLLILAGAGSGKTRTLTHRVAHLIGTRGVEPWRILAVTFTNKAAAEMRERLERLLGGEALPWVSTFHAACVRILRRDIEALGFATNFVIYDDRDSERLLKDCLEVLRIPEQTLNPRQAAALIDAAKNKGLTPRSYARGDTQHDGLAAVYTRYQEQLRRADCSTSAVLLTTVRCSRSTRVSKPRPVSAWSTMQDFAPSVPARNLLAGRHRNLCVVGDDDPVDLRRGAEIRQHPRFRRDYPNTVVIRLGRTTARPPTSRRRRRGGANPPQGKRAVDGGRAATRWRWRRCRDLRKRASSPAKPLSAVGAP